MRLFPGVCRRAENGRAGVPPVLPFCRFPVRTVQSTAPILRRIFSAIPAGWASAPPAAGRGVARFSVGSANVYLQERRLVFADGRESPLSRADADILSALHSADGAFLTCSEIISRSRGDGYAMDAGTIRSEIFRLKTKLGKDGERIQGERGFGYRLA